MGQDLEQLYRKFDTAEQACANAAERRDSASTRIGHFFADKFLQFKQLQLEHVAEETETGEFQIIRQEAQA